MTNPDMMPDFDLRLRTYADVIVRVGLNLQPGQRLLIAEPYELQGVSRESEALVEAVKAAAMEAGHLNPPQIEVIWGDGTRLREFAAQKDWRGLSKLVAANAHKMNESVQRGDALLFLVGRDPGLMAGIPAKQIAEARNIGGEYFGGVAQQLTQGATNWTAAPAPSPKWAEKVYADLPVEQRLGALWETVFESTRIPKRPATESRPSENRFQAAALAAWQVHLRSLQKRRDELNAQHYTSLHYQGEGTDLTVKLPPEHRWCTASLRTNSGIRFVANLPTEEIFTLPHRDSAHGTVRLSRPITFGGSVIDGIELEFQAGRVIEATARSGAALLQQLIDTDDGAGRLGEVALLGGFADSGEAHLGVFEPAWSKGRLFHHTLLDENAGSHIALGEGYGFCLRSPDHAALNRSLIHVDLPIAATAHLIT